MRHSAFEVGRKDGRNQNFQSVKSLSSFQKASQPIQVGNVSQSSVRDLKTRGSKISFHDFLPNSITRSPQNSTCSHSQTTMRLGLNNLASRLGQGSLMDDFG